VPESWAHDHSLRSYGSRAIKKGKAPVEHGRLRLFKEMIVAVKFKVNLTVDLDGSFRGIEHRIFEIKGSEDSRNVRS
jgi:hypothetical protein